MEMKLLIVTAVKAFEKNVRMILEENGVLSFSYAPVTGYRDSTQDSMSKNWFGTEMNKVDSLLFFAFVPEEVSETVFEKIEQHNENCTQESRIHISVLPIEKHNPIKK